MCQGSTLNAQVGLSTSVGMGGGEDELGGDGGGGVVVTQVETAGGGVRGWRWRWWGSVRGW